MDHLHRSLLNTFTAQPLDRSAFGRKDAAWLATQLSNTQSEYLILDGYNIVCSNRTPLILSYEQFQALDTSDNPYLLGLKKTDNSPVFIVNISESKKGEDIESLSLRDIISEIDSEMASMYSYATLLNNWHITTRFCTCCGYALEIKEGGSMQQCTNDSCARVEFPRINPAVIMRVTKGNKILLARQANWPEHMYSVLAGFVELGETLEQAVAREVMEEVSIAVKNIHYHSSQPWPFPNSMMLGYTAEAVSEVFDLEQDDIDDALWLTAEELKIKVIEGSIYPSSKFSISHRLIDDWFKEETGISLSDLKS